MRVLMISKALVVEAYHAKLKELTALGVKLDLVIPARWGKQLPERTHSNSYTIHVIPAWFHGQNHFHLYRNISRLFDIASFDLIHVDEEPYSLVTWQMTRHAISRRANMLFFTWQNISKKYPFPFSWIEGYAHRHATLALAGNAEARDVLIGKGFSRPVHVIPQFGVDPGTYTKRDASDLRRELFGDAVSWICGFAGRLVEEKGIRSLLEAFRRLDRTCGCLLLGSGPLRDEILAYATAHNLQDRVRIVEHVPSKDVPRYLNAMNCLVLPSLTRSNWKEQFGRILIEAMACEVPVIGSDSGEIPNVIGTAGLIFREGNVEELARALDALHSDRELARDCARQGRQRVHECFTQRRIAEMTLLAYSSVSGNSA